jgi:hypothetical protein
VSFLCLIFSLLQGRFALSSRGALGLRVGGSSDWMWDFCIVRDLFGEEGWIDWRGELRFGWEGLGVEGVGGSGLEMEWVW